MRMCRSLLVAALVVAGAVVLTAGDASASASKRAKSAAKWCESFGDLQAEVATISPTSRRGDLQRVYRDLGKAFRKSAKKAPKDVKKAMNTVAKLYETVADANTSREAAASIARISAKSSDALATISSRYGIDCASAGAAGRTGSPKASSGGARGSVTIGGETYALSTARCYLEEQPVRGGGGGTIELTGQGEGTTDDGQRVALDFTRYDEESRFAGDDITVDVGQLGSSTGWSAHLPIGSVQRSGTTLSASDVEFTNSEDGTSATGSFELDC